MSAEITFEDVRGLVGTNYSGLASPPLEIALNALFHGAGELNALASAAGHDGDNSNIAGALGDLADRLDAACKLAAKLARAEWESEAAQ